MSDLNQCSFIGRLGKDVETRITPAGDTIANFSIAVDWKTKTKEGVEWVNISAFGKLGEICSQYLVKGSQVFVQGKMKTDRYEDKAGVIKYITRINADTVQFLGKKGEVEAQTRPVKPITPFDDMDDDIPF